MRYALATICPPLALWISRRPNQAIACAILFAIAIVTAPWGIGAAIDFFLILWATNAVGDEEASREARAFIKTVRPIPVTRD